MKMRNTTERGYGLESEDSWFPEILPIFDQGKDHPNGQLYQYIIQNTLKKVLPKSFFLKKNWKEDLHRMKIQLKDALPVVNLSINEQNSTTPSFYLLTEYRPNLFKFFFEMVSNWLIPGQRFNILLFQALDFSIPILNNNIYALCELIMQVDDFAAQKQVKVGFPSLASEIRLGVSSPYFASRILESKGLSVDEKVVMIQDNISSLIKIRPNIFNYDLLAEMQHLLAICPDEFKNLRESRHLSRMIGIHYLFRKALKGGILFESNKRYVNLKIFKAALSVPGSKEKKKVLGIVVGVNFLDDKEVFDSRHIMKAIQEYIINVQSVDGSLVVNRLDKESICTLYLEIEKNDGTDFTGEEIKQLRRDLALDLKDRIEHLMHPVFMPRNEEEVMRNILSLSNQIKYLRDLPQLFVTFDEQSRKNLFFTIIIVRLLKSDSKSIQEMFQNTDTFLYYIHDFQKIIGCLRKKYDKEATVFRVKIPKKTFLREDHSIDLYKARSVVVVELVRIIGKLRDFNGGLITKQNDLLNHLRQRLGDAAIYNDFLLENFFYSLTPAIVRTLINADSLKILFLIMVEALEKDEMFTLHRDLGAVYIMILSQNPSINKELSQIFLDENILSAELACTYVNHYGTICLGYIYTCDDPYKQDYFCQTIESFILHDSFL